MSRQAKAELTNAKRIAIAGVASALLASGASLALSAPAQAIPSNCSSNFLNNGGTAMCGNGTGQFRVVLGCKDLFGNWAYPNSVGPWHSVGQAPSNALCPWGYGVQWTEYQVR